MSSERDKILIRYTLAVPRERVFDACSRPNLLEKWFFPGGWSTATANSLTVERDDAKTVDFKKSRDPCDSFGPLKPDEEYFHVSEVIEVSRPERISFRWSSAFVEMSIITLEFREIEDSTELTLRHEGLGSERNKEIHLQGWTESITLLTLLLEAAPVAEN